jgi:hypothetical protein
MLPATASSRYGVQDVNLNATESRLTLIQEGKESIYTFKEAEPDAVCDLLEFLYTADFNDTPAMTIHTSLALNALVFHLASQYLITPLKELAATKFASRACAEWESDAFAEVIQQVYETNPHDNDELKDCVVEVGREHSEEMLGNKADFIKFHEVIRQTPCYLAEVFTNPQLKPAKDAVWFECSGIVANNHYGYNAHQSCQHGPSYIFGFPSMEVAARHKFKCPGNTANAHYAGPLAVSGWNEVELQKDGSWVQKY